MAVIDVHEELALLQQEQELPEQSPKERYSLQNFSPKMDPTVQTPIPEHPSLLLISATIRKGRTRPIVQHDISKDVLIDILHRNRFKILTILAYKAPLLSVHFQ